MQSIPRGILEKFERLTAQLKVEENALVALSGGVDSSLVAAAAKTALGDRVVAVTAESATLPPGELEEARMVAEKLGLKHFVVRVDELRNSAFVKNTPNRCYHCKKELIRELKRIAAQEGIKTILEGTNADDLVAHRPGAQALREEEVRSPLAEVGLTKDEIRILAEALQLPTAGKPSMACLASRFPYGEKITADRLFKVAEAERIIRSMTDVKHLRVRLHGNIVRVEVDRVERRRFFDEKLLDMITEELHKLGFTYVTLDMDGYRSGSMNEALKRR
jgi:uncharacterized protein